MSNIFSSSTLLKNYLGLCGMVENLYFDTNFYKWKFKDTQENYQTQWHLEHSNLLMNDISEKLGIEHNGILRSMQHKTCWSFKLSDAKDKQFVLDKTTLGKNLYKYLRHLRSVNLSKKVPFVKLQRRVSIGLPL